jgi:hypothetical protein
MESANMGRMPVDRSDVDLQDVLRILREEFGTRHEQAYERGKRDFRDVLSRRLDLPSDEASSLVDDMEEAQVIRFKSAGEASTREPEGPRIGLFDEPGPRQGASAEPSPGGRYWALGDDEDVDLPGAV